MILARMRSILRVVDVLAGMGGRVLDGRKHSTITTRVIIKLFKGGWMMAR